MFASDTLLWRHGDGETMMLAIALGVVVNNGDDDQGTFDATEVTNQIHCFNPKAS